MRPGDGPAYLWYVPTLDPRAGVVGVYYTTPPETSGIRYVPLYSSGLVNRYTIQSANRLSRLRDWIGDELEELIEID